MTIHSDFDNTPCWVYVVELQKGNYHIAYSLDVPEKEEGHGKSYIVFQRRFLGVANALAYKLLLESVHPETLKVILSLKRKN